MVFSEQTTANQAALYRLSGDLNPLHIDPGFAKAGGFDSPILHGLCFFGFAQRAVIKCFCGNDASRFRSIRARFAASVYPGERLITEMWLVAPNRVVFRCKVAERGVYVLQGGIAEITPDPAHVAQIAAPKAAPKAASKAPASAPSSAASAPSSPVAIVGDFKAAAVFAQLAQRMPAEGAAMVKKVRAIVTVTYHDSCNFAWVFSLTFPLLSFSSLALAGFIMILICRSSFLSVSSLPRSLLSSHPPTSLLPTPSHQVGCTYRFDLTAADGASGSWLIDLKSGSGAVRACTNADKADCMIAVQRRFMSHMFRIHCLRLIFFFCSVLFCSVLFCSVRFFLFLFLRFAIGADEGRGLCASDGGQAERAAGLHEGADQGIHLTLLSPLFICDTRAFFTFSGFFILCL